jgi:hypothetical protein
MLPVGQAGAFPEFLRAPIPAIEVMYHRLVYVVTRSGIGPMLGLVPVGGL